MAQEFVENSLQVIGCSSDLENFLSPAATSFWIDRLRLEGCVVSASRSEDVVVLLDIY